MIVPNGVPRPPALHAVCTVPHGAEKQAGSGLGNGVPYLLVLP